MARTKQHTLGKKPPPKPRNKWTRDQRLTLHLIDSHFTYKMPERTRIFNAIFADHLLRQGFSGGMPLNSINAQYAESEGSKPCMIAAWRDIIRPTTVSREEAAKRDLIVEQIARVARTLPGLRGGRRNDRDAARRSAGTSKPAERGQDESTFHAFGSRDQKDLASRFTYCSPPHVARIRRHTVGFVTDPEDVANKARSTESVDKDYTPATSPSPSQRMNRPGAGGSKRFPSLHQMADTLDLDGSDDEPTTRTKWKRSRPSVSIPLSTRSTSKRGAHILDDSDDRNSSDDDDLPPAPKRARYSPEVVMPVTPKDRRQRKEVTWDTGLLTPPKTKFRSSIAKRRAKATEEYARPNGRLMLTHDELEMTKGPLVPPMESEAHPPLAGLLLRQVPAIVAREASTDSCQVLERRLFQQVE